MGCYNKVSFFTTSRQIDDSVVYPFGVTDYQWYHWEPMVANGANGKITNEPAHEIMVLIT